MRTLGICVGASTVSMVGLTNDNGRIAEIENNTTAHNGDSKGVLVSSLKKFGFENYDRICITGRKFRKFINLTNITEPEATEFSIQDLIKDKGKYNALVSAGGETILVYELDNNGRIYNVFTGNKSLKP